uniref:RNA-directed DNA polymerase n=1 Tax=Hirondellea gigas TaxID=1518452 RepID=A0A6A7FXQ6_9CRUS
MLLDYSDVITADDNDVGHISVCKHRIELTDEKPRHTPQWRLPYHTKRIINEHVEKMLDSGVIENAASPWCSPVLLVKKSDGTHRFCVDYRQLNAVTKKESYPLPNIIETIESISGAEYYTVLDAKNAFHQVEMEETSKPLTAFHTSTGSYQFNRMPFGLFGSGITFMKIMNTVLRAQIGRFAYVYLDDVVAYAKDFNEHIKNVKEILQEFRQAGVKIGISKCHFAKPQVKYLGHLVDREGSKPDPSNLSAMHKYPRPTTARKIRQFLGACGYYRRFIADFAIIAQPLINLTKKGERFKWTTTQEEAFNLLRTAMINAPVLKAPDFQRKYILHCDASKSAYGSVLNQEYEGNEHPVAFFSRTFKGPETRYTISEKEALAIVASVKHFAPYLQGEHFTIVTDHQALKQIFKYKYSSNGRLARWALSLSEYDFEVKYKSGKLHVVPDALSRNPVEEETIYCITTETQTQDAHQKFEVENLRKEQLADAVWGPVLKHLEGDLSATIPNFAASPDFYVEDRILKKRVQTVRPCRVRETIVVPQSLRKEALVLAHDSRIGAHQGITRTWKRATEAWFWINMTTDIKQYVKTCIQCQKRNYSNQIVAPMGDFPAISRPLDRVGVDLMELPPDDRGHRYVLTIVDHFSRYVVAYPLKNKSTEEVTQAFASFMPTYGVIRSVISDRGTEFTSRLFTEVCKRLDITFYHTTAYHPQSNGLTERYNRTLKQALAHIAAKDRGSWDRTLPWATLAMNTAYQSSIEEIPFFLFHGRDANVPLIKALKQPEVDYSLGENYAAEMSARLHIAFKTVKEKSDAAHERSKQLKERGVKNDKIEAGAIVFLRNETHKVDSGKEWPAPFIGPFRILNKTETNAEIQELNGHNIQRVHLNRLKIAYLRGDAYPHVAPDQRSEEPEEEKEEEETIAEVQDNTPPMRRYNLRNKQ